MKPKWLDYYQRAFVAAFFLFVAPALSAGAWWEDGASRLSAPGEHRYAQAPWWEDGQSSASLPNPESGDNAPWYRSNSGSGPNRNPWADPHAPWYGSNGAHPPRPGANGDAGTFYFGGPSHLMEHWMDMMEHWGNRMEDWANRWQTMQGMGANARSGAAGNSPTLPTYLYDPTLEPLFNRWGER